MKYTTMSSPLGWIALAASTAGLSVLHFCGEQKPADVEIEGILQRYRPGSALHSDAAALEAVTNALRAYFIELLPLPPVPLDLTSGTPFQQSVWRALCQIPFGKTRSYGEIAALIGHPRAARAVGHACGRNPIAVIVPCHRVIGRHGALGGYTGGLHLKKALLALEQEGLMRCA